MARRRSGEALAYWRGVLERQAASGLSIGRFCDQAGVSTASFHAWKRKLKLLPEMASRGELTGALSPLVPVRVIGEAGALAISVELPGGIVVRIPANDDPSLMRAAAHFTCELSRGVSGAC